MIDGAVGNHHVCTCRRGIHLFGCRIRIIVSAFIHVVKNHRRGNGTGHIHTVEHQGYHRIGIFFRLLPQVYRNLATLQSAAEDISAGLGNGHHSMFRCFFRTVFILLGAFPVSEVSTCFVVHNVVGDSNACRFIRCIGKFHIHSALGQLSHITGLRRGVLIPIGIKHFHYIGRRG